MENQEDIKQIVKIESLNKIAAFQNLIVTEGWRYFVEAVTQDCAAIAEEILDPSSKLTLEQKEKKAWQRYIYISLIKTPEVMVNNLKNSLNPHYAGDNIDPYETIKTQEFN